MNMGTGWLCPRCGSGNAPWLIRCPCVPYVSKSNFGLGANPSFSLKELIDYCHCDGNLVNGLDMFGNCLGCGFPK